ncbi:MAG TPA: response regulator [Symbiobacteriaceae bacterium]|nr:response regulator [Symbiobacteriaceae bacterium]
MITVVVVEDDPTVAKIHRRVVERVPGFAVLAVAETGQQALDLVRAEEPDLVVLDMYLPDISGLEVLRQIRGQGLHTDVIVISAAREADTVREVLRAGAVDYLVKPFRVDRLIESLEEFRQYRKETASVTDLGQDKIDQWLGRTQRPSGPAAAAPQQKGIEPVTLGRILGVLRAEGRALTGDEAAALAGVSRSTSNRYLRHLVSTGQVKAEPVYGSVGRPELLYHWDDRGFNNTNRKKEL